MFDNDDLPVGRIMNRREALILLGMTGAAALIGACAPGMAPESLGGAGAADGATAADQATIAATNVTMPATCVVRPEMTEGPLFVEEELNRTDIRVDPSNGAVSDGAQLDLTFRISSIDNGSCTPLESVKVDIWHCDAHGVYSDTNQLGMNTVGQKFLRGYQLTDASGVAHFTTIYPGWYQGRTVHIHIKVRNQQGYEFTSQLFFDDGFTDDVFKKEPYASRGARKLRNAGDGIYQQSGDQMVLAVQPAGAGYAASFDIALDLSN